MTDEQRTEMLPAAVSGDIEVLPRRDTVTVEEVVQQAVFRQSAMRQIITRSIAETLPVDWVNFDGKPYLQGTGAERIRKILNLTITGKDIKKYQEHDVKGDHYMFVVSALARITVKTNRGDVVDEMDVIGTATSRDKFFAIRNGKLLPPEEIDQQVILNSAYTDMIRQAVVRMLGLRGLTWDYLEQFGIFRDAGGKVTFRKGGASKAAPAAKPAAQTAAPKQEAPAPNGAASNGATESFVQQLKNWIAAQVGDHGSPEGLRMLRAASAFKDFPGYASWESLERGRDPERAAQVYLGRMKKDTAIQADLKRNLEPAEEPPLPEEPGQQDLGVG